MKQHYPKSDQSNQPLDIFQYFASSPDEDYLDNDILAKVFALIPSMTAFILASVGAMTHSWDWISLIPTMLASSLIAIMGSFFLSLECAHGHMTFFRNASMIMTLALFLVLSMLGGVSFVMLLLIILMFVLFLSGEWLCLG